ncbi:MAG: 2-dehydro-3-deoxyphosphogluconate aldolase, partial [Spirochaetales bacterium]
YPGVTVGAGSVLSVESLKRAADAGAAFFVAPCLDLEVIEYASALALSFIPGVATPSELNQALRIGCDVVKIFPAGVLGGVKYIDAVTAPFKTRRFGLIPTGGIDDTNVAEYLNNPFVIACGASSIVDQSLIGSGDYVALARKIRSMKKAVGA